MYNINAGDVFWAASDVGWVVGHSYIVYAPLLVGATTVMYEENPSAPRRRRVLADHRRPQDQRAVHRTTAIRAIRKADPDAKELFAKYDVSSMHAVRGR